jgi:peptidoglycan/LPS O-acetylase OafA/YrhL
VTSVVPATKPATSAGGAPGSPPGLRPSPTRFVATAKVRPASRRFRPDIEGLRAVAILLVVLYHATLGAVRGGYVGVDAFFVISGFLITRQLFESVRGYGLRALPRFYAHRIRRLLPAAALVVVSVVVVARFWAPPLQVPAISKDALFTTFYGLNVRLAQEGTQYLHADDAVSPLQHFWSLAVEEQFYLCWPALLAVVVLLARRAARPVALVLLAGVVAGSVYLSVRITATSASWAYFSLPTRAWELAIGGLIALGADRLARLPRPLTAPAAWLGLGALLFAAFWYRDSTPYPGTAAILPVAGAALVIAAGCRPEPSSVEGMLAEPVMQGLGRVSYSWYLWHWPMLIIIPMVVGHDLPWPRRLQVVLLSLAAAVLTYFIVERPMRQLSRSNLQWLQSGLMLSSAVVIAASLVLTNPPQLQGTGTAATLAQIQASSPAATAAMQQSITQGLAVTAVPSNLEPTVDGAAKDVPPSSFNGCHLDFPSMSQGPCVFGDPNGTHTVVLFGDSHMEQWLPAVIGAAGNVHWKVVSWTKSACPVADLTVYSSIVKRAYTECDQWRAATVKRIQQLRPDLVLASQSDQVPGASMSDAAWALATVRTLRGLAATGSTVDFMLDIPVSAQDVPSCVAEHLSEVGPCNIPATGMYLLPKRHDEVAVQVAHAGFTAIEPRGWFCTGSGCPAIVGNVLVYRNSSHMTATYSRWLSGVVQPLLAVKN